MSRLASEGAVGWFRISNTFIPCPASRHRRTGHHRPARTPPRRALPPGVLRTLPVGLARFQNRFDPRWDLLMAGSVLAAVPVVIGFVLLQRLFVRGLTGGAVKE